MARKTTATKMLVVGMTDLHDMQFDHDNAPQNVKDAFRRLFGSSSETCTQLWNDLVTEKKVKKSGPYFFLLTMLWLKSYRTELDLGITYQEHENTLRKYFWFYVHAIQSLKQKKVRFS
jgi:hypothetical protein